MYGVLHLLYAKKVEGVHTLKRKPQPHRETYLTLINIAESPTGAILSDVPLIIPFFKPLHKLKYLA